jgi:hypothetical protein
MTHFTQAAQGFVRQYTTRSAFKVPGVKEPKDRLGGRHDEIWKQPGASPVPPDRFLYAQAVPPNLRCHPTVPVQRERDREARLKVEG